MNGRLHARVSLLEAAKGGGGVTIMWRLHDETDEQAVARWRQENPGEEPHELNVIIVRWADPLPDHRVSFA